MITFSLEFNLDEIDAPLDEYVDKLQRTAALDLWGSLVVHTPIDTGRARAGWSVKMDGRDAWAPAYIKPPPGRKPRSGPLHEKPAVPQVGKGADFFMVYNNVEYVGHLNYGTSKRSGVHFIEKAIEEAKARIKP